jgi:hypothetical protein
LTGTALRDRLLIAGVMTASGEPTHALNIVQSWDPSVASIIVLFPVVLSLCIAITWSVVASVHYKADVQVSMQTGFTIGSYVITAGMFGEDAPERKGQLISCKPDLCRGVAYCSCGVSRHQTQHQRTRSPVSVSLTSPAGPQARHDITCYRTLRGYLSLSRASLERIQSRFISFFRQARRLPKQHSSAKVQPLITQQPHVQIK